MKKIGDDSADLFESASDGGNGDVRLDVVKLDYVNRQGDSPQ